MSITPAEREIEKASERAQESGLDGLLAGLHDRAVFSKESLLAKVRSEAADSWRAQRLCKDVVSEPRDTRACL